MKCSFVYKSIKLSFAETLRFSARVCFYLHLIGVKGLVVSIFCFILFHILIIISLGIFSSLRYLP